MTLGQLATLASRELAPIDRHMTAGKSRTHRRGFLDSWRGHGGRVPQVDVCRVFHFFFFVAGAGTASRPGAPLSPFSP
jgi:hypothetical protein